ncbi:MAG: sigma-70 family RNA polymerase sigma factor [Bacteroidota bacterium]
MTDEEIIQGIRAGGREQERCVNHLFTAHKGLVGHGMGKYGLGEDAAIDAFSDAVLGLRKQILADKFRGESKLSTYLFTIFSRRCVDQTRKKTTHGLTTTSEYPEVADQEPGIERKMFTQEAFDRLMGFMNQLGEVCREILMYRYYWGYEDMAEIAELVGAKNANTAGSLRHRCMKQLMKIVGQS